MSDSCNTIRTYNITLGKVYNNGVECKNPIVEIAGRSDIAINCIDEECGIYSVQVGPNDEDPCIKFIITCEECGVCPAQIIEKCFCDTIDDCKDCEICGTDGFCQKLCEPENCCDNGCCDCKTDEDCICNQLCVNGDCKCPVGSTLNPLTGCCDECKVDGDCTDCEVCIQKGGYKQCVVKECPGGVVDYSGKCGPKCECVECLNSGSCPTNECCTNSCGCDCCSGFVRVNGVCIPAECVFDTDCETCEICQNNRCTPVQCPPGQVPVNINGVCNCAPICNCENPDCESIFNYCTDSIIDGLCGCVPCQGSCQAGCDDPCICNEDLNKCVFNPCQNQPCDDGLDCPFGCGCLDGKCVSCDILSCTTNDCKRALGCECNNQNECGPAGCDPNPCSISSDCPLGCTCYEGVCVSCSNFPCPTDCALHDGCACVNNTCQGSPETCNDTITITKDDENCELTGTLTKNSCCSCSALTLDVKKVLSLISGANFDDVAMVFMGELRKGAYDGISVDSNPRLDDFTNPNIASNEPPTSGTLELSYKIIYDIYNVEAGGTEVFFGTSTSAPFTTTATFSALGDSAQVIFNSITIPLVGKRETIGQQVRVVRSIQIVFSQINPIGFPNNCIYDEDIVIGTYNIIDTNVANLQPIGTTIKSKSCRKPFFKWTKSTDANFDEAPFRKLYPAGNGPLTWEDTITIDEGLESCKYYLFQPDCSCKDPVSEYVVLCNPEDINFTLTQCNTHFKLLNPFTPCEVNENQIYRIQAGSLNLTFTGTNPPINTEYISLTEIEEVI